MRLRSLLYVPGHSDRFLAKAHERGADAIILDLEDAVPEADKDRARDALRETVAAVGRNGAQVFVRINTGERQRTDAAAARAASAMLMVAKADLAALDEIEGPLLVMLEDPGAVLDARAYARHPSVMGLCVGAEDLATALGAEPSPAVLQVPKLLVHYAAKAEGKLSIGMLRSVADYNDLAAIEESAQEARMHGFDGATCVHPSAVPILNAAFSPSADEVAWAERVLAAGSEGAFVVDGRMVDAPVIARARRILGQ
jgi:citrate lyase subunit beta/citryl-CoA lyase